MRSLPDIERREPMSASRLRRLLALAALALLVGVAPFTAGLIGALILAVLTAPVHRRLARVASPRIAAAAVTVGVFLLILLPASWLVVMAAQEALEALRAVQESAGLARAAAWLQALGVPIDLASVGTAMATWLSTRAVALFGSATRGTLNTIVALFGLYYLLTSGARLWARVTRLMPFDASVTELLRERFVGVTDAMLLGTLLTALLQGTLVGLTFALVGLRAPVFWGVVTACVSVLPVLGSAIVWLPGAGVLLLKHEYGAALILALVGVILVSNLDNVVRLVLYRRISGLHPMVTLVGAFAGVGIFGVVGVLLGPLLLSYFFELVHIYEVSTGGGAPAVTPVPAFVDRGGPPVRAP